MLSGFDVPRQDELVLSACARYGDRAHYPRITHFTRHFFGVVAPVLPDFPFRLRSLVAALSPDHPCNIDKLLQEHTLLPLYRPFLSQELQYRLETALAEGGKDLNTLMISVRGRRISAISRLRYCPSCVEADRHTQGFCYWHCSHHIPGLPICHQHAVWLEDSTVMTSSQQLVSLERYLMNLELPVSSPRTLDMTRRQNQQLLIVAQDAFWLLQKRLMGTDITNVTTRWIDVLIELGLATYNRFVSNQRVVKLVRQTFDSELLTLLDSAFDMTERRPWPARFYPLRQSQPYILSPIQCILLIQALGMRVPEFFQHAPKREPFGDGPWPCLNPICKYYKQPSIKICRQTYSRKARSVLGTFACGCGFTYVRVGPDTSAEDYYRIGQIRAYGVEWEAELKRHWSDTTLSFEQLANHMGVARLTVKGQAERQGLPFPRIGTTVQPAHRLAERQEDDDERKMQMYRKRWLEAQQKHPELSRSDLSRREGYMAEYQFLRRYDRLWFENNSPSLRKSGPKISHVNWEQLDSELVPRVVAAAEQLRASLEFPQQITMRAVADLVGELRLVGGYCKNKLPHARRVLQEVCESPEDIAIRRVTWALHDLRNCVSTSCITRTAFAEHAGVGHAVHRLRVRAAIDDAILILQRGQTV